jgi:hypothetical protein
MYIFYISCMGQVEEGGLRAEGAERLALECVKPEEVSSEILDAQELS